MVEERIYNKMRIHWPEISALTCTLFCFYFAQAHSPAVLPAEPAAVQAPSLVLLP